MTVETFGVRAADGLVRGLVAKQADVENEVTGPPKSVAYDNVGAPTRAAVSFSDKQGVSLDKLYFDKRLRANTSPQKSFAAAVPPRNSCWKFCRGSSTTFPGRAP